MVFKGEEALAYIIRAFSCVIFAPLFRSPFEQQIEVQTDDSCRWKLEQLWRTCSCLQGKSGSCFCYFLEVVLCFLPADLCKVQRKGNGRTSRGLYAWQSSRLWCWKVVSLWILRSIPLELFLLFSKSPCVPAFVFFFFFSFSLMFIYIYPCLSMKDRYSFS